jgi:expansin
MKKTKLSFLFILFLVELITAQETNSNLTTGFRANCVEVFKGEGTYYGYTGGGNCSYANPVSPNYTAAINETQYGGSITCGACIEVKGERGSLVVSIEDRCPECKFGDVDLNKDAFPKIADPVKGRVPISWKIVACPINTGVKFRFKEGTTQYWAQVQVRNHRYPISKLEFKAANGKYVEMPRRNHNYFESKELGAGPFDFRITDMYGGVIEEKKIPLKLNEDIKGVNQFPLCSSSLSVQEIGSNAIENKEINIFPNPATNQLLVNYNLIDNAEVSITVFDMLGKKVISIADEKQFVGEINKTINVEGLQKGVYFLKVNANQTQYVEKLFIE